jgi:hypothetical protein
MVDWNLVPSRLHNAHPFPSFPQYTLHGVNSSSDGAVGHEPSGVVSEFGSVHNYNNFWKP